MAEGKGTTLTVNGMPRDLRGTAVVSDLVRQAGLDPSRAGIAVAVNGEVVPRAAWESRRVRAGDEVEIVGAVQGG